MEQPHTEKSQEILQSAFQKHQDGHFSEAIALYKLILDENPLHFDALHLTSLAASQSNQYLLALKMAKKAIEVKRDVAAAHNTLGIALQNLDQSKSQANNLHHNHPLNPIFFYEQY